MTFTKPAPRSKQYDGPTPTPRVFVLRRDSSVRAVVSLPKEAPKRSREYLRWVASRPCCHCGRPGPSQAAHADEGKGMGLKSSDETAHPLCADAPGRQGCHSILGASGMLQRDQRRRLERNYGAATKAAAISAYAWPKDWPT